MDLHNKTAGSKVQHHLLASTTIGYSGIFKSRTKFLFSKVENGRCVRHLLKIQTVQDFLGLFLAVWTSPPCSVTKKVSLRKFSDPIKPFGSENCHISKAHYMLGFLGNFCRHCWRMDFPNSWVFGLILDLGVTPGCKSFKFFSSTRGLASTGP